MTAPLSTICCPACGYLTDPADPYPFRCPQAGTDDADHLLTRVLNPAAVRFPGDRDTNPFLLYRTLMHSYHVATARGLPDGAYRDLVDELDAAVAEVDGHGFRATPFSRSPELSDALGFDRDGGVWVKDETGNVSGSHKGRHLMGVLIHLAVMERSGLLDPARRRELAIASCGNAALAAAVVARACDWPLTVFVPLDAEASVVRQLHDLGAKVIACPREPGTPGDPAYLALRRELDRGALPFTTQGPENGLAIEGGLTLGYELVTDLTSQPPDPLVGQPPSDHLITSHHLVGQTPDHLVSQTPDHLVGQPPLHHLIIQVGGGALASSVLQALREAADLGVLDRLPRVHAVQTTGAYPLAQAYRRVAALLPDDPAPDTIRTTVVEAARHRSAFMQPWPEQPVSVAAGILDDETYDWRAVVEGMLLTGGQPLVVSEETLIHANQEAVARTGIPVDPTGSSGLAGLLEMRRSGQVGDHDRVAVLFTGLQRGTP